MSLNLGSLHLSLSLSVDKNSLLMDYMNSKNDNALVYDFNCVKTTWNMSPNKSVTM